MTPEERYLFDLSGFLVLSGALPKAIVDRINDTVGAMEMLSDGQVAARGAPRQYSSNDVYAQVGETPAGSLGDYVCPALGLGTVLEELIDWPSTVNHIDELIGRPFRLDAACFMARGGNGAFRFHHGYSELLPYSEYGFHDNQFQCVSVKIAYALSEVGVEDGCFAIIPGSHKSHFRNPLVGKIPDPDHPLVMPIESNPGDAILFSEDLSHGAVENHSGNLRRTLFYSYAPAFHCRWGNYAELSEGFERRATPRRRELVYGTGAFGNPSVAKKM